MPSYRTLIAVLIIVGLALRVFAYASTVPFWLDEVLLARNIIELPLRDLLFAPLALDQVAPPGFLLMEKLAVIAFGPTERALRLFPFLCGVASLFLFARLSDRLLRGWARPLAIGLCAIGVPFLKYGAEVKQYHTDAAAAMLLTLLALDLIEPPPGRDTWRRRVLIGASGFVIVTFSQASVVVMGGLGAVIAIAWLITRRPEFARALVPAIGMWAVASGLGIAMGAASMTASTRAFMQEFWQTGFAPLASPMAWPGWYWSRLEMLFGDAMLLNYPWPPVCAALGVLGVIALWRVRPIAAAIVVAPIVTALMAATAQQYPFRQRLAFFLVPFAILLLAAAVEWLRVWCCLRWHRAAGVIPVTACAAAAVIALAETPPPYDGEHQRDVLQFLQERRQPGDVIYVFPLSRIGVFFYGPQYGVSPDDVITSPCDPKDTRAYLRGADVLRGRPRVWLISTGVRPYRIARPAVRRYLETIGVRRDGARWDALLFNDVTIDLYDLSDPARLAAADAETFPAPPMPTDPPPGCRPWTQGPLPPLVSSR